MRALVYTIITLIAILISGTSYHIGYSEGLEDSRQQFEQYQSLYQSYLEEGYTPAASNHLAKVDSGIIDPDAQYEALIED